MRRLGVFARVPIAGAVKTRLSPALPPALAVTLHRAMIEDVLATARAARADDRTLWWDGPPPHEAPGFTAREQRGGDLGERIANAFEELNAGGARAVIAGTDCPALDPALIDRAFEALEHADVALAPARDGGYVLVGLARPAPGLFRGIEWSTPRVLAQTLERAHEAELSSRLLEPALDDVDTPDDLVRLIARQYGAAPIPAPAVDRALRALGLLPPAAA